MNRFQNKVVIITGGETGIGRETAKQFLHKEAEVFIAGMNESAGEELVEWARLQGKKASFISTDVTDEKKVSNMINHVVSQTGKIDILVNNAAIFKTSSLLEETTENWRNVFDVILHGAYLCTKYAANEMKKQGEGIIINVSSINAHRALDLSSHYNTAKGAVDQLTRCSALELSQYGIRVNGVAPGFIETPMSIVNGVNEHETDEFVDYYVKKRKIPLARQGFPEEVAKVITFLASVDASYIQGAIIPVDGGLSITF